MTSGSLTILRTLLVNGSMGPFGSGGAWTAIHPTCKLSETNGLLSGTQCRYGGAFTATRAIGISSSLFLRQRDCVQQGAL